MKRLQVLPLRARVDLGVMATKKYLTNSKAQEQELHYQMQFGITLNTRAFFCSWVLILSRRYNQGILNHAQNTTHW